MPAAAPTGRRRFLVLAGLGTGFAAAGSVAVGGTARADADPSVIAPIQGLYSSLLTVMKAGGKTPFAQRFDTLAPAVDRALDLPVILQTSVGPGWSGLPPDQQAALLEAFRSYTVSSYVSSFNDFNGQRFDIDPALRSVGPSEQIVQTKIVPASGTSHQLDYVMRQSGSDWKAVDVLAEGTISRVATQRSDFRALLARGGGAALLASLKEKTADLAGK